MLNTSSRAVPSKTENCSSVFLHLSMNTERTDIDLWQLERTKDLINGMELNDLEHKAPSLSCH